MQARMKTLVISCASGIGLLGLDGLTKLLANRLLPFEKTVSTFIPVLLLYRTHNIGYHFLFGAIRNHFLWAVAGLIIVTFLIASLIRSILKEDFDPKLRLFYAILLSLTIGATGNVIEIILYGHATDFFILRPFPWPSNLCDQFINAIIYILLPTILIKSYLDHRRHKRTQSKP